MPSVSTDTGQAARSYWRRGANKTNKANQVKPGPKSRRVRWAVYFIALCAVAWIATQAYYFVQIAAWSVTAPSETAFMRAEYWRLRRAQPPVPLRHAWVPYSDISRNLKRAIIASEDANFVNNNGYEIDSILQAWEKNKKRGRIVSGGSTITQQLARNLFLSAEKNYVRKGQEFIITWMLELLLSKERIFEIYLNSVEWGVGVFGAEAAAQYYFHTPASKLSVSQAARLAVMLPRPRFFDVHRQAPYLSQRARIIARRMGSAELP